MRQEICLAGHDSYIACEGGAFVVRVHFDLKPPGAGGWKRRLRFVHRLIRDVDARGRSDDLDDVADIFFLKAHLDLRIEDGAVIARFLNGDVDIIRANLQRIRRGGDGDHEGSNLLLKLRRRPGAEQRPNSEK